MKIDEFRKMTLGLQTIYNESRAESEGRTNHEND